MKLKWNASGETTECGRWMLNSETIRGEGRWWFVMSGPKGHKQVANELDIDMSSCTSSAKRTIQNRCQRIDFILQEREAEAEDVPRERLRALCDACPWADMDKMRSEFPTVVAHAEAGNDDGFVCHTRCGPCDGPKRAARESR